MDYGNIEVCTVSDLRPATLLTKIPIMADKYCLAHLKPNTLSGKWPVKTLDFIHMQIVEKVCSVKSVYDDILAELTPINLKCGHVDISDLLLTNEMALHMLRTVPGDLETVDILYDFHEQPVGRRHRQKLNVAEYKSIFDQRNAAEEVLSSSKENSYVVQFDHFDDVVIDDDVLDHLDTSNGDVGTADEVDDDDDGDDNDVAAADTELRSSFYLSQFQPNDTSTQISETNTNLQGTNIFDNFKSIDLNAMLMIDRICGLEVDGGAVERREESDRFVATVGCLMDALNVWIFPHFDEHIEQHRALMEDIQSVVGHLDPIDCVDAGTPVLARFKCDGLYYRGVVKEKATAATNTVQILFVDYLDVEWVSMCDVRICPKSIQLVPLRLVLVRLNDVRLNPRMREVDIQLQLAKVLDELPAIMVKIVQYRRKVPIVELIDCNQVDDYEKLVYQSMINDKFYVRKSPILE